MIPCNISSIEPSPALNNSFGPVAFETLVEHLSVELSSKLDLFVYCSSISYPAKPKTNKNTRLYYIPLKANGAQRILYDVLCIIHSLFYADALLVLGVSGCVILPFIRVFTKKKIIVNIDGLEWKRNKWGYFTRKFLKFSESLAVRFATTIISDNAEIQRYVQSTYSKESLLIAYGGDHTKFENVSNQTLVKYPFLKNDYAFKVCRIEPENNIEMILEAFSHIGNLHLVIVGNWDHSQFSKEMFSKYTAYENIHLVHSIYEQNILNQIRCGAKVYIHGHSAGGTNPSLVEAMSLSLPVFSFDINYNVETTQNQAYYFQNTAQLISLITALNDIELTSIGKRMKLIANENYVWRKIALQYFELLE